MIVTPLIIWFLAPLFLGGALGFLGGYALSKLVKHVIKVKHLNKETAKQKDQLNDQIKENLEDNKKYNKFSMKDFLAKEDNEVYGGKIDTGGNLTEVTLIEYDTIDYSLNRQLDELDEDKVLLI